MPADLPLSPKNGVDGEFARWMNEFAIRSEKSRDEDWTDLRSIADQVLDDDEKKQRFIEDSSGFVEALKSSGPMLDRLPVVHVTRENLTEVENRSEIPEGFIDDLAVVSADYINGFIPGQDITPPHSSEFDEDMNSDYAGSYNFRDDLSKLYATGGSVDDGSPAATVSAHETMHKNNVEAVLADPSQVRHYAIIYKQDMPQSFKDAVEESDTARVNHDLLGGLGLMFVDEFYDVDILEAFGNPVNSSIDLERYSDEFENAVGLMEEAYDLEFFDVRDEAICQALSFFMDGSFEEGFESRTDGKRDHYNMNEDYSLRAGDAIVNHLRGMKAEYEMAEGLRGQRFKQVMEKRIPFLKGEQNFNKY